MPSALIRPATGYPISESSPSTGVSKRMMWVSGPVGARTRAARTVFMRDGKSSRDFRGSRIPANSPSSRTTWRIPCSTILLSAQPGLVHVGGIPVDCLADRADTKHSMERRRILETLAQLASASRYGSRLQRGLSRQRFGRHHSLRASALERNRIAGASGSRSQ